MKHYKIKKIDKYYYIYVRKYMFLWFRYTTGYGERYFTIYYDAVKAVDYLKYRLKAIYEINGNELYELYENIWQVLRLILVCTFSKKYKFIRLEVI